MAAESGTSAGPGASPTPAGFDPCTIRGSAIKAAGFDPSSSLSLPGEGTACSWARSDGVELEVGHNPDLMEIPSYGLKATYENRTGYESCNHDRADYPTRERWCSFSYEISGGYIWVKVHAALGLAEAMRGLKDALPPPPR